ncbi:hypothetical protein BMH31_08620 [Leucobacter sp. OLIS6]|uniref:metallophosphoesterase n=2 Tax=Leucobacter TaxID=55968 RepID=UPI000C17E20E|nr:MULTISPECIES: metallophosphoesterase [unclassified Leucobacter]PII82206.1 hypothetical protein BMH25_09895 [Leucobacter sp. OLCALW19]PII88492.1 hypothetical protein BMH26_05405 [Leucobacter sp. OLTLW20]PII94202.1 hypothetical protein BMH27_02065 [Leucobacter sp. OLAS13]PII98226.1 hypothetical protein BMH29_08635 [Leucobacter sp. OLDS2]PIJ03505.1 hypothetical protein BMH31_08620 [Leucobacter sp. OLIS6]
MHPSAPSASRRRSGLAAGALLALMSGLVVVPAAAPAFAAPAHLTETFETASSAQTPPAGWLVDRVNTTGMRAGWEGWTFHTTAEVTKEFGNTGDRGSFGKASGMVAVVQSDSNRPTTGNFDSTLWSAPLTIADRTGAVTVKFDSHYKQGQNPPSQLLARIDGGAPVVVKSYGANGLNTSESVTFDVPKSATKVEVGWAYLQSSNNWFWMIDNVDIAEAAPKAVDLKILSAAKPLAVPGAPLAVRVGGLREGQQLVADLAGTPVTGIPKAGADGTASFDVTVPAGSAAGVRILALSGDGITPAKLPVTVVAKAAGAANSTEPQRWFDGIESTERWQFPASGWEQTTLAQVVDTFGVDRRQAFTRASGRIAVADASKAAVESVLKTKPIGVTSRDALELRFDSHYRKRGGAQRAAVTAVFDTGQRVVLNEWTTKDQESAQSRLPFTVPAGAQSMTLEFGFTADAGAGSWMIDDVAIVKPLAALAAEAQPVAAVDVISDIQGATARLRDQTLPGLRSLTPRADTIVANGDLTSNGTATQYDDYFAAFNAGGGKDYATRISTIGNHEYYGSDGVPAYVKRFLDKTSMREVGGQGGLWGEHLVDGQLPLIWLGSEGHVYHGGGGPFVDLSDQQFTWLSERFAYWKSQGKPVLLMTHHVFNNSVSGTYAKFYQGDYGADTERIEALLAQYSNVTVLTSHTHWSPELNDWSVEQRFDPSTAAGPTIVNTAAVTTQYGPSGDWNETAVGGADPIGLRVGLYKDRLRVTAYYFGAGGAAREAKHIDVALPAEAEQPTVPKLTVPGSDAGSPISVEAGGSVGIAGSGFAPDEQLALELHSAPVAIGTATADEHGAFSQRVTVPADAPAGAHTIVAVRDGETVAEVPITVTRADTGADAGADAGAGAKGNASAGAGANSGANGNASAGAGTGAGANGSSDAGSTGTADAGAAGADGANAGSSAGGSASAAAESTGAASGETGGSLPVTGGQNLALFGIAAVVLLGAGAVLLILRRRRANGTGAEAPGEVGAE